MFTVTIEKRHILAALKFAAVNDVRYYLNGICIEAGATESRVIATDGHRMAVIRGQCPDYGAQGFEAVQCAIIGSEAFKGIKKAKKGEPCSIVVSINAPDYQIQDGDTIRAGKLIDGKFPEWRRVVPSETTGIVSQFNSDYMGDFGDVARILGKKWPMVSISHNGGKTYTDKAGDTKKERDGGALVTLPDYPEFVGVVMPCNAGDVPTKAPAWAFDDLQPAELQAAA